MFINDEQYGYNISNELISADEVSYAHDDIGLHAPTSVSEVGNRTTAEGKTYAANNLNQYTAIDDFTPQYDDDGNQTLIKTETGVWSVVYNAENRPVHWQSDDTVITMSFDRMGRRVDYQETRDGQVVTHFRFVYDNFLCVQRLNAANGNAVRTEFVWDPTEPIATRPLVMRAKNWGLNLFYTHDGNKNVSEVIYHALQNGIAAHYDYAPFGAVTRTSRATRVTNRDILSENPFRFSSEYHDETLMLVYYNYRMLSLLNGRWTSRERNEENERRNLYLLLLNSTLTEFDYLGDSRQPSMPKTFPVYPYPSLSELQKYSCGLQYIEGPRQTLPEGECCISDLDGTYSITFVGESYPDPKPTVIQKSDGTTHFIHRRLRIGAVCIQKIVRLCLSPRTYQLNTYLIDGKSGIWEESELENAKIEF